MLTSKPTQGLRMSGRKPTTAVAGVRALRSSLPKSHEWTERDLAVLLLAERQAADIDRLEQDIAKNGVRVSGRGADVLNQAFGEVRQGRVALGRPLSNSTINRTIGLLAQILDVAVEYGHIGANPARGKRRKLKADRPQRAYLDSAAQITALLDAAAELDKGTRADRQHIHRRAQLATLIFAGLRIGEFLALRWGDVDLAGGWITVQQSKTDAGRRKVKIRPVLRDVLLAHKPLDASPGAYVFATGQGKALHSSNVRVRVLSKAVERANERLEDAGEPPLPRLTPHGLRRTFASLLYGIGETSPVVMAELGHTDPGLALSIYAQAMRRETGENESLLALVGGEFLQHEGVVDLTDTSLVRPAEPLVSNH